MTDNPPCKVDKDNWCERHKATHEGRFLEWLSGDTEYGAKLRLKYDGLVRDGSKVRKKPTSHRTCIYLSKRVRGKDREVLQRVWTEDG